MRKEKTMDEKIIREARRLRSEYMKAWREKNPDKVKKNQNDYWRRKAEANLRRGGDSSDTNEND